MQGKSSEKITGTIMMLIFSFFFFVLLTTVRQKTGQGLDSSFFLRKFGLKRMPLESFFVLFHMKTEKLELFKF